MFYFISKGSEKCCHKTVFALLDHFFSEICFDCFMLYNVWGRVLGIHSL